MEERILVIEADEAILKLLLRTLVFQGYWVDLAPEGRVERIGGHK